MKKLDKSDTYKRKSITHENFDYWFDWMVNNVEIAEKEYPEMMELVRKMVREKPPYFTAAIIEKIPEHFVKWKNDIENCLTSTREKKIKTYIELIELLLYQIEFNTDIENNAVKKIEPELIEMEQYFKNLLQPSQKKKGFQSKLTVNQIKSLYEQMQGNYFYTSPENFMAIFNQNLTNFTPIKRTKKFTNSLLIYFASELFQKENPNDYVRITEYCFNVKNLSKSQNNYIQYNSNHKPKGFQEIDKIIQTIYTPLQ